MVARIPLFAAEAWHTDFTTERLRWIIQLRWFATGGILAAAIVVQLTGGFPGVSAAGLVAVGALGLSYNTLLWLRHRKRPAMELRPAVAQALVDIGILTAVLWASGGLASPFAAYYVFHVALVGVLAGPRAATLAAGVSLLCAGFLLLTDVVPAWRLGTWAPLPPYARVTEVVAFVTTIAGITYIVTHAVRELRDRESDLKRARDQAALEFQLLSNTLKELHAGLEVVGATGQVLWRNKRADQLALAEASAPWACRATKGCTQVEPGRCPYTQAQLGLMGRCRFPVVIDGSERIYEMLSFPLPKDSVGSERVMNLYLDRTQAMLDERRLVTTERLVSLGRVAQGVAHELNTPLATIRTLAADMRVVLDSSAGRGNDGVRDDLDESAAIIHDETIRLGRITHALLAGGDLVRTRVHSSVSLQSTVDRACALVSAGLRDGPSLTVDPTLARLTATADPDRLLQILVNLLQNALDAVGDGEGGAVSVAGREGDEEIELFVEDNGPGLSADLDGRLFEPFATTKPPGKGTGLGLYTSYMLAQAMGGTLTLESRAEGGARATVRLPRTETSLADGVSSPQGLSREPV